MIFNKQNTTTAGSIKLALMLILTITLSSCMEYPTSSSNSDTYEVQFKVSQTDSVRLPYDSEKAILGKAKVKLGISIPVQPDLCYYNKNPGDLSKKSNSTLFSVSKGEKLTDADGGFELFCDVGDVITFEKKSTSFEIEKCGASLGDDVPSGVKVYCPKQFKNICEVGGQTYMAVPPIYDNKNLSEDEIMYLDEISAKSKYNNPPFLKRRVIINHLNTGGSIDNLIVRESFADDDIFKNCAGYVVPDSYLPFSQDESKGKSEFSKVQEYADVISQIKSSNNNYLKNWDLLKDLWCKQHEETKKEIESIKKLDSGLLSKFKSAREKLLEVIDYNKISYDKVSRLCSSCADGLDDVSKSINLCSSAINLDLENYQAIGDFTNTCKISKQDYPISRETMLGLSAYVVDISDPSKKYDLSENTDPKFIINGVSHISLGQAYKINQSGILKLQVNDIRGSKDFTMGGYSILAKKSCPMDKFYIVIADPEEKINMSNMREKASAILEYSFNDDFVLKTLGNSDWDFEFDGTDGIVFKSFDLNKAIHIVTPRARNRNMANGQMNFVLTVPKFNSTITKIASSIDEMLMNRIIGSVDSIISAFFDNPVFGIAVKIAVAIAISMTGFGFLLGLNKAGTYDAAMFFFKVIVLSLFLLSDKRKDFCMQTYVSLNKLSRALINVFIEREDIVAVDKIKDLSITSISAPKYKNSKLVKVKTYKVDNSHLRFLENTIAKFFKVSTWIKIFSLSFTGLLGVFYAILIAYASIIYIITVVKVLITYFTSVIMTGILVAAMPVISVSVLFKHTSRVFAAWLKAILGIMLAPMIVMLSFNILDQIMGVLLDEVFGFSVSQKCYAKYRSPAGSYCLMNGPMPSSSDSQADISRIKFNDEQDAGTFFNAPLSLGFVLMFVIFAHIMAKFMEMVDEVTVALTQTYGLNITDIASSTFENILSTVGADDHTRRAEQLARNVESIETSISSNQTASRTSPGGGAPISGGSSGSGPDDGSDGGGSSGTNSNSTTRRPGPTTNSSGS